MFGLGANSRLYKDMEDERHEAMEGTKIQIYNKEFINQTSRHVELFIHNVLKRFIAIMIIHV